MEQNEVSNNGSTISLKMLWNVLKKRWYWLLLAAVLVVVIAYFVYDAQYVPVYSCKSVYYVSVLTEDNNTGVSKAQITSAETIAPHFSKLANCDELMDLVKEDLSGQFSRKTLSGMVSSIADETAFLTVTVTSKSYENNIRVARSLENIFPRYCDDLFEKSDSLNDTTIRPKTMKCIQKAQESTTPINAGSRLRYPAVAGLAAAILVYAVFFLMEMANTTVYTADDIKQYLPNSTVIGSIDHWALEGEKERRSKLRIFRKPVDPGRINVDRKLILRDNVPFRIAEAFHELRTNITFCATKEKGNTLGVISVAAGSGKSFIMANLAASLSKLYDKKVLLVDGDMRMPMLHKVFSLKNKVGLSNLIAGQVKPGEEVKHSFDSLDVITSGTIPPNPIDLLTCRKMQELMEEWKKEYDYILVDLPPIGEVSDALAVAAMIDGYLTVVRSGHMDGRILRDTQETIASKGAKIYGCVITDIYPENVEGHSKYGNYHYGKYGRYSKYYYRRGDSYGYGYGADAGKAARIKSGTKKKEDNGNPNN